MDDLPKIAFCANFSCDTGKEGGWESAKLPQNLSENNQSSLRFVPIKGGVKHIVFSSMRCNPLHV